MTEMIRIKRDDEWKGEDNVWYKIQEVHISSAGGAIPEFAAEIFGFWMESNRTRSDWWRS